MFNKILKKNSTEEEWCNKPKIDILKKGVNQFKRLLKNNQKRVVAFALSLLTFGSTLTPAVSTYALESISFDHSTYLNAYYSTGDWKTADGTPHNNSGQVAYITKSDGTPVYCIQVYEETTGSSGTTSDIRKTDVWKNELSETAQQIITRASIYGYDNTKASRTFDGTPYGSKVAYLATQAIIWEAEMGKRTDYSTTLTDFATNLFTNYPDAKKCYKGILAKMKNHRTRLLFSDSSVDLDKIGSKNAIIVKPTDATKDLLSEFKVVSTGDSRIKASVSKDDGGIKIYCTENGQYSGKITLEKIGTDTNTGGGTALAINGTGQKKLCGKIDDPVVTELSVDVKTNIGEITIHKKYRTDADNTAALDGAEFTATHSDGTKYTFKKTSTKGEFKLTDLPMGQYTIKETKVPKNYLPAKESWSVTLKAGDEANYKKTIDILNHNTKVTLKVRKFSKDADGNKHLITDQKIIDSLNFEVQERYKDSEGANRYKTVATNPKVNSSGYIVFKDLKYTDENEGWFRIVENGENPLGVTTSNALYEFYNDKDNMYIGSAENTKYFNTAYYVDNGTKKVRTAYSTTFYVDITNDEQYGTVKVKKTATKPEDASGIKFTLSGKSDLNRDFSMTATTVWDAKEKAAYAVFENVPVGKNYTLTENMTGHIADVYVDQEPIDAIVVDWNKTSNKDFKNTAATSPLNIKKTSENGKVDGFQFKVTGAPLIDESVVLESISDPTDNDGNTTFNNCKVYNSNFDQTEFDGGVLTGNNYTVEEINVPEWYITPDPITGVKIEKEKVNEITFNNVLKRGNLDVQKVIENYPENSKASLAGFVFTLSGTSWSGEPISIDATTDENGVAHFKDVLISNPSKGYTLHETSYPAWYTPEGDKTVNVVYDEANTAVIYSYTNAPTRGSLEVQKVIEEIPENAKTPIIDFSGFEFTLSGTSDSGDKVKLSLTTEQNGKVTFKDVLIGTYKLTETEYPSWYTPQYPDGLTVRIDENGGKPIKVSFDNYFKRGSLEIQKEVKNIPDYVAINLAGFEFTLTGTSDSGNNIKLTATTDANGKAKFNDVLIGDYTITETKYPEWYTPQYPDGLDVRIDETNEPIKVSFENYPKLGDLVLVKAAEDGVREGFKFRLHGTSNSGDYVDLTLATNAEGWVVFNNIPIGKYTIEEIETPIKYVQPESQEVTINWNERTELWLDKDAFSTDASTVVHFDNILKKFRVEVSKLDSEKNLAQGNATLEGAEYGIYKGNELIDTYTTDAEGKFLTDYYICDNDWTIKEINPSVGYLLDETVHKVGSEPELYEIELNNAPETDSFEDVIKGDIAIIKHSDNGDTQIETPEVGATFEVFLKSAGSYENADPDERDILVCDENGFAQTKLLPYGVYTMHQTKGAFEAEMMPDFDVFIKDNGATKHFIMNNKPFESHIKVEKKDAETHKNIPYAGAGFQIYDPDGNLVRMKLTYPTPTFIDTFYTDANGEFTTPEKLPAGEGYKLVEVEAPYGYVLDSTPVEFDVTRDNSASDFFDLITVIKLNKYDIPQKGSLSIYKEGEIFSSVNEKDGLYTPVFANKYLSKAVYEIFAAEDITTPDGTVRYNKGELVDTVKTDKDGIAESKELYLGKYKVVEKTAPDTFTVDTKEYDVEFTYQGQHITITREDMNRSDERQKVEISLAKVLEKNETYNVGNNKEILNVEFGVFANEDIEADDGTVIPKHGLICSAHCDKNGKITFPCDLPIGYKFYVQEIATDEHYQLDHTKYKFDTNYAGQDIDVIHIDINNGEPIENTLIAGNIEITKSNEEGKLIEGVKFGIFANDCTKFTEKNALFVGLTNERGKLVFDNVPYGDYQIVELQAAKNYIPNAEPITVSNKTGGETVKIDVVNKEVKGFISVTKTGEVFYSVSDNEDATKNFIYKTENLKGAKFDIIAAEDIYSYERSEGVLRHKEGEVIQTLVTDENGLAKSDELYLGKYKVVEKTAPDGFKINNNVFEISLDFDNRTNDIVYSELTVDNTRQKAAISLTKEMEKDETFGLGNKNEIENVVFGLFSNEEMTAYDGTVIPKDTLLTMQKTDKDGKLEFNIDIPYGYKYYVQEIATDNHYSLSDEQFKFDFNTNDRDILGLDFTINDGKVIVNYLKRGTININKVGEVNASDDRIPLSDTVFGLFHTDCTEFTEDNAIMTVTTDENGYAKFEFVDYGEFIVREIQAHEGYVVNDEVFNVEITDDEQYEVIDVFNELIRGSVTVQKVDADFTDRNLEDALFYLYNDVDNNGVYDKNIDTPYTELEDLSNGLYEVTDVPYGHYLLKEEEAPHGFEVDENYYPVFICENGKSYDLTNNGEFFINNAETGELRIIKTSSDGIVEGFEFLIEGKSESGTDVSITAKTDKNGIVHIPIIRTGTYKISEINSPERYVTPEPQNVTITNNETVEVKFFNKVITGTIEITKTDVVTGKTLPNTLIEILDKDGNVIRSGETDENGVIKFKELPYGTYFYKESKAPKGYRIDETPHEFSITEEGQVIKAIMTNQAIEDTPNTGTSIVYVVGTTVALSAALGILLVTYKRKKDTVTE